MEIKDILKTLREKNNLTQEQLADKVMVTRQAVSRWENGETQPNTETLKLLSKLFDVSINTLLGDDQLICKCCGTPLDEISANNDYCEDCYDYFTKYQQFSDEGQFEAFVKQLINEINDLNIDGMPTVTGLNPLPGKFVNLSYRLPSGEYVKFLDDNATYLGNQLESLFDPNVCFGVLASLGFIMVCTYGEQGSNPELIIYKQR